MIPVAWLQLRQMLSEKRAFWLGIALCSPLPIAALINYLAHANARSDDALTAIHSLFLYLMYVSIFGFLLSLLYFSTILHAEVEGQTIVFLFSRNIARWKVVFAKYLAISLVLILATVASATVAWQLLGSPYHIRGLSALVVTMSLSVLGYGALYTLMGVLFPSRAMIIGFMYSVFEFFLSFFPALINKLTVAYHLRLIAVQMVGSDIKMDPDARKLLFSGSILTSLLSLTLLISLELALAFYSVAQRSYIPSQAE